VFYMGGVLFDAPHTWGAGAYVSLVLVFGGVFIYDALYKSPLAQNARNAHIVAFLLTAAVVLLMKYWGGFSYRGYVLHTGAMFGTIMAFNVWFRIWPAQQQIINAVKGGQPPDAALVAMAGSRSRHNTYLSVPLIWTMINFHSAITEFSEWQWVGLLVMVLLGWHVVFQFYRKATQVQGF
jgi:uncharacterized membrane protein